MYSQEKVFLQKVSENNCIVDVLATGGYMTNQFSFFSQMFLCYLFFIGLINLPLFPPLNPLPTQPPNSNLLYSSPPIIPIALVFPSLEMFFCRFLFVFSQIKICVGMKELFTVILISNTICTHAY